MNIGLYVKYPLFLSDFNDTRIFSKYFRKMLNYRIDNIRLPHFVMFQWPTPITCRKVSFFNSTIRGPDNMHYTKTFHAVASLRTSVSSTLFYVTLKQCLRRRQFQNNEDVKIAVRVNR
jgi:hypothetical protein